LISALKVAEEFQQNLLPHSPPEIPGLDLSGVSIYCQETGGDYFDYLELPDRNLGIVVADASDHGIGAAIHTTTARAFLLYGAKYASNPAELIGNVNQYLVKDSSQTGRFVSMFLLEIDPARKSLRWVRAGHEPAILYDPLQNDIQILTGDGIALGVDHKFRFQDSSQQHWESGSIVVIGTDGIHETRNPDGRMYGRKRMQDIVREHHLETAAEIQKAIIDDLHQFKGDAPQEDDITLVVIKLL
jgi:sigma-B regulation protein RsbU (phosphoserine phosphatase)